MASKTFDELNEQMLPRLLSINPDCATIFGKHDPYDRHLPHGGFRKLRDNLRLLIDWKEAADEIASREELSRDQSVSLQVLTHTLDWYRFAIDDYAMWKMRPEALEMPGTAMLVMLVRDYAPMPRRLEWVVARIEEMPRYLEQFRRRFAGARTVRMWTEAALDTCRAFPSLLDTVERLARKKAGRKVRIRMTKNIAKAREEVRTHEAWLHKVLDSSTDEFAMGREKYAKLIRIKGLGFTPQEILDLAYTYLARYKRRRASLARRITRGGTVDDARRVVESDHPRNTNEVVKRTRLVLGKAKEFVIKNGLVTVRNGSRVHVMRTPKFLEGSTPSAATYLPAVFETSQETIYLITDVSDPEQLGSIWNYAAIESTVIHEGYPGHHHQGVMSNAKPWMHQLPHMMYSAETLSPPYESQEGWATYCESLMREKGFLGSDRHAFSMLDYAVWTACRAISEVKLACEEAGVEDMIEMAMRESGWPRALSERDVKGFTRMPGYGVCYLLGRHLVTELKKSLKKELHGKFSEKRFHDLVAENSNLPFYLLDQEVKHGMAQV